MPLLSLRELLKSHFAAGNLAGLLRAEREGRVLLRRIDLVAGLPGDPADDQPAYQFERETEDLLRALKARLEGADRATGRPMGATPGESGAAHAGGRPVPHGGPERRTVP